MTWTELDNWRPTAELRLAVPDKTTTKPPVLQQLWVADRLDAFGYITGRSEDWREVPRVVVQ